MGRLTICALACAVLLCVPAALAEPLVDVHSFEPNWVHIKGGDSINVCGCGFSKYENVICIFNNRWASRHSYILDDGSIVCESPEFDLETLQFLGGAPTNMRLDLIFNGDVNLRTFLGWIRIGPEINPYSPIEPSGSYVRPSAGTTLTVHGQGFDDVWSADQISIYLDKVPCASVTIVNDTALRCNGVPEGKLNQNAVVTVEFDSHSEPELSWYFYLHSLETWHYGPVFTSIAPSCAGPRGGETMTIVGQFLDDPAAITGVDGVTRPMILLKIDGEVIQSFNTTAATSNTIQFTAPDLVSLVPSFTAVNTWGDTVVVEVYEQQVFSITTQTPLSYVVGAFFFGDIDPTVNGSPFGKTTNSWPHFGGQDRVCIAGCGFDQFANSLSSLRMLISENDDGTSPFDICDADQISVTGSGDESFVCCGSTDQAPRCVDDQDFYWGVEVTIPDSNTAVTNFEGDSWEGPTTIGPVFEDKKGFITTLIGGSRTVLGHALRFSNNAAVGNAAGWTSSDLCYEFDQYVSGGPGDTEIPSGTFCNSDISNGVIITDGSDSYRDAMTFTFPANKFDTTANVIVSFSPLSSSDNCHSYLPAANHWGPFCGPVDFYLGDEFDVLDSGWGLETYIGTMSGGQSINLGGIGLNQYGNVADMKVLFCQRSRSEGGCSSVYENGCGESRFNDNDDQVNACQVYMLGDLTVGGNLTGTVTSPSYDDEDYLWGDHFDVFLYWPVSAGNLQSGYQSEYSADVGLTFGANEDLVARKYCGNFRYGPVVTTDTCFRGPEGPLATSIPHNNRDGSVRVDSTVDDGAISGFALSGMYMADTWANEDFSYNYHLTVIGDSLGQIVTGPVSTSISSATLRDAMDQDAGIVTLFDTCNKTAYTSEMIRWGPEITGVTALTISGNPDDGVSDLYGFKPFIQQGIADEYDIIVISGYGFEAYCSDVFDDGCHPCWLNNSVTYDVRVIIDNEYSPWTIIRECDDNNGVCSNGCYVIEATVPPRPFGTIAQVAVEFGNTDCPDHNPQTEDPPSGFDKPLHPEREIDFTRVLIADQRLHYEPKITSVEPFHLRSSLRIDSNLVPVTFTVTGYGFSNWDTADLSTPYCYFDDYKLGGPATINSDTEVTCTVPDNLRGEFNTVVKFSLQFDNDGNDREVVDPNARDFGPDGDEYYNDAHDWKIIADQLINVGPSCSISPAREDFTTGYVLDITGSFFRDCQPCDELNNPSSCASSVVPDHAGTTDGELYCLHRYFDVEMVYGDEVDVIQTVDPYNSTFSDNLLQVYLADVTQLFSSDASVPCPFEAIIRLRSKDALVHEDSQLVIECEGTVSRGPIIEDVDHSTPEWVVDNVYYGWVGDEVTVTGHFFQDTNLGAPKCVYGSFETDATDVTDTSLTCTAPSMHSTESDHWDDLYDVYIVWPSDNDNTPCREPAFTWHYGPALVYNDYCEDPYETKSSSEQTMVIGVIAGDCWDLVPSMMRCVFPSGYQTTPTSTSATSLTCVVPNNVEIYNGIAGIGVAFFHSADTATFYHTASECFNSNDGKCLFETVDDDLLSICYGVVTGGISPEEVRMSYIALGDMSSSDHDNSAQEITVSSDNSNFDESYVNNVECWLSRPDQTDLFLGLAYDITVDDVTCSLERAVFSKSCHDQIDRIFLKYNVSSAPTKIVQELVAWAIPETYSPSMPVVFGQTGDLRKYGIQFGPAVTAVHTVDWTPENPAAGTTDGMLRSYVTGGLNLEVTIVRFEDWLDQGDVGGFSTNDWGTEEAVVLFDKIGAYGVSGNLVITSTLEVETTNGPFNTYAELSVLLDPHYDYRTSSSTYHFTPYVTNSSLLFGRVGGGETIAYYGSGFCRDGLNQVVSKFGESGNPLGGFGSCDVTTDHIVVCQTPESGSGPRSYTPSLLFNIDCEDTCGQNEDEVRTVEFTYYGVDDLTSPWEAPHYGDTEITFHIHGVNHFETVECWFDNQQDTSFQGTLVGRTANSVTCVTPNMNGARATIPFVRVYNNPEYYDCVDNIFLRPRDKLYSTNPVIFGEPCPTTVLVNRTDDVNTTAKEVKDGDVEVYVEGRFFNGGADIDSGAEYECMFFQHRNEDRDIEVPGYEFISRVTRREQIDEPSFDWTTYRLYCDVPANVSENGGGWGVKVRWDGAEDFSECTAFFIVDAASLLSLSPLMFLAVFMFNALFM